MSLPLLFRSGISCGHDNQREWQPFFQQTYQFTSRSIRCLREPRCQSGCGDRFFNKRLLSGIDYTATTLRSAPTAESARRQGRSDITGSRFFNKRTISRPAPLYVFANPDANRGVAIIFSINDFYQVLKIRLPHSAPLRS